MSATLTTDLSGITRIAEKLREAGQALAHPARLMNDIGAALTQSSRERFDTQTDPEGVKWKRLALRTEISRMGGARRVFTQKGGFRKGAVARMDRLRILFAQGHLRNSLTWRFNATSVEIGTNLSYGAIHQFGGQAGRGKKISIPARPYLGLSNDDQDRVEGLIQDHLAEVLS